MNISGKDLKRAIKASGLTQEEAAKKLNITRQTLNVWNKLDKIPGDVIQDVRSFLGIDLELVVTAFPDSEQIKNKSDTENLNNLYDQLITELRERLKEKDERLKEKDSWLSDKDIIIATKDEALMLWKEKAIEYEKKISTGPSAMGNEGHVHSTKRSGK